MTTTTDARISYTVPEASAITGIADDAIRLAIHAGKLRAKRQPKPNGDPNPRGMFVVTPDALRAWLDGWPDA